MRSLILGSVSFVANAVAQAVTDTWETTVL